MIINIIILIVVVCIAWVVWTERKNKQALNKGGLDQAWREVLDYVERRHYEERKRIENQARAAAAKHSSAHDTHQMTSFICVDLNHFFRPE
jgi:lipopolysaccharide export system protein LptC